MRYNLTINNNGALPIPYITKCGQAFAVASLCKDKPLFADALFIGATAQDQLLVHCITVDYILALNPDLEIKFQSDSREVA
jgi:hypothetical protein